eukprot:105423-Chlamydomonas_euryale.AAC.2
MAPPSLVWMASASGERSQCSQFTATLSSPESDQACSIQRGFCAWHRIWRRCVQVPCMCMPVHMLVCSTKCMWEAYVHGAWSISRVHMRVRERTRMCGGAHACSEASMRGCTHAWSEASMRRPCSVMRSACHDLGPCGSHAMLPTCGTVRLPVISRTLARSASSPETSTSAQVMPASVSASLARLQYGHARVDTIATGASASAVRLALVGVASVDCARVATPRACAGAAVRVIASCRRRGGA